MHLVWTQHAHNRCAERGISPKVIAGRVRYFPQLRREKITWTMDKAVCAVLRFGYLGDVTVITVYYPGQGPE